MGGSFEGSEEGIQATIALYNNWVSSLGNPTNVYEANSREANENLLLDTYMLVLTDRKNVTETRLPLDKVTGIIKNEILPIVDGSVISSEIVPFNEMSPTFQMNKKYEYSGGKTGIGPFALNNKNHVLTQLTNLMFKDDDVLKSLGFTGLNGIKSQNEQIHKRDEDGNYEYDENGLPIYENEEGLNILDWISAMINAHVDVAKDPYVIRLNVRQYTYNICNFLLRAGFGKNTFYFLPQPILKEMAQAYERANGIYGVKGGSKTSIVNAEIQKIRRRYYKLYADACAKSGVPVELDMRDNGELIERTKVKMEEYAPTIMDRDYLIDSLQDGQSIDNADADVQAKYYRDQLRYSELFLYLNDLAQDMSKLVQLSQIDTKRYGGNFVEQDRFMYRLKSFLTTTRLFKREDVENYFANTFLLTKAINGMVMPASIFQDVMFRSKQTFKNAVSKVLTLINRDTVNDPDLNKTIANELEGQLRWQFLSTLPNFDLFDMLYGHNSMSQRLANIKRDIIAGKYPEMKTVDGKIANKLLNHLTSLARFSTDAYNAPSIIATNSLDESDKFLKQDLKLYWEELLESPHDEIRQFATDLIYYELATTGGNFTKNGIWNILPVSAILNSGYATFIDNAVQNFTEADINYNELFLNNWTNGKIVPAIETTRLAFDEEVGENYQQEIFPILHGNIKINGISTRVPVILNPYRATVGKNSNDQPLYTPYVKVIVNRNTPEGTLLYKYVGIIKDNKDKERPIYVLTNKKGLNQGGRVVKEYDGYSNSIFNFNNIEKSLLGNAPVTPQAILDVINNLGDKDEIGEWVQRIQDTFSAVNNFLPSTQAMNTDLLTLGLNISQNDNTTPVVTPESVDQGDTIQPEEAEDNIFTFRDGTQIQIPFKLNDQQTKALLVLEDFIKNPKKYNNVITLSGYAGTGKSTLIGIFDKYLQTKFITPNYSAPTHRANAVTQMNNPNAIVRTLHSLFGLSPLVDLTDGNYDLRQLKNVQRNKPQLKDNAVLIIDEASMISKGLFKFIEEYKNNHNVKIIYVGDDAQLSPVNDDSISPVFTGNQTKLQLTKVERTGDNAILAESTRLRNGEDFSYETRDNVEFTNSSDRANEVIDTIVNSEEFKSNPLYFRILSATNDMISDANNRVRRILFGDNAKQIEVGDIMMGYNNVLNPTEQGDRLISNSIDYVVTEVGEKETNTVGKVKVSGWHVTLEEVNAAENNKQIKRIFVLDNNISDENLQKLSDHYKSINTAISQAFADHNYNLIDGLQQEKSWFEANTVLMRDYVGTGNRLLLRKSLDYGYAHTIHKSQGGTYNNVLIYADTINRFNDPLVRQQLKYVAMSRAKDNVTVLTNHSTTGSRPQSTSIAEEWSKKEGWSVDYFNNKVLPKLNQAWQIEYKVADNQNIDDSNIKVAQSNFDYGNNKRTEVTANNTLQAIKNGERTSTTRYEDDKHIDFWKQFKVGDYIKFVKKDANGNIIDSVIVEITKPATKLVEQTTQVPESVQQTHTETLQVLGGVSDTVAQSEMKDAIKVAKEGVTFESALSTVNPVFTPTEIAQIKQALNGKNLKVMSVSRYTDPAFFANEIIKFLEENAKKPFTDPTRVNVIELWTKHDGEPIQKILQACRKYKVAPMVSFSITTLGNTPLEQGVLEHNTLLDLIQQLVNSGDLDPRTTTIRIDPILVGYTNMDNVREVVRRGKSMGIRKYVTSLVQSYGYTEGTPNDRKVVSGINNALNTVGQTYDWDKYYGRIKFGKNQGKIEFKPKQEYIDQIGSILLEINQDPEIELQTCSFTIKGLKASACLDPLIIERVTGVSVTRPDGTYERDTSRPECMCYGCHGDKFRWDEKKCFSSCAYCYAAHSGDSNFEYYNNDGTLKNRPLTRVSGQFIGETGNNPKDYNLYSGGATGSDTKWAEIANKYGIGKTVNYRPEHLDLLTPAQTQEVETAYIGAVNKLGRKQLEANTTAGKLVRRDYLQAKAADSIFAVGHILRPGEKNAKGYTVRSTIPSVDGGTGYAVQMGIDLHKPVHVYDQVYDQWYRFDYNDNTFVAEDIPTLTPKFAGIGTREINDKGINAIEQVFQKTFGSIQTQTEQPNTINIWHSSNENADLSNFAIRPFDYKGYKFDSVEQGFQFAKIGYATNTRENQIIGNKIMFEKSGAQLRKLGKSIQGLNTKEWDANKYRIMKDMIKASFEQNPKAEQKLLSTGDAVLTHRQDPGEWKTKFPELLMEVRSELGQPVQQVQEQQQPAKPFDLTSFATFDESELQSDPDIQELNNKGEQIKNDCKGN